MTKAPPILPDETLRRVLRVARFDGLSMCSVAGLFALLSAASHDVNGALIGVLVAGAGAMELHGVSLLHRGAAAGTRWLLGSQFWALCAILGYAAWRVGHPDPLLLKALIASLRDEQRIMLKDLNWTEDEFVRTAARMVYCGVALATMIYQGGMMIYYARRSGAVLKALGEPVE